MLKKALPLLLLPAVVVVACSFAPTTAVGHENPERAVVAWFDAVDTGDAITASGAVNAESLALILSIENDLQPEVLADYLDNGVPLDVQASYWSSFSAGFTEFSSRPISTLTVGESETFTSEGVEFASVPVRGGAGNESVVIARKTSDDTWQVDLVASLGDGFTQLLASEYDALPASEAGERIRRSYAVVVVPSLWAAMTDGTFGDDFTRAALALIESVGGSDQ